MARDMKAALTKSVEQEREAVEDRFARAESILGNKKPERKKVETIKPAPKPKSEKPKVIRDSFTLPEGDYKLITTIREKCLKFGFDANKGEIVRAGLRILAELKADELRKAVESVERVKTGRPKTV